MAAARSYYDILGITKNATHDEIRKAYKKKALSTHPDRVAPEAKEQAEAAFRAVSEAYEVLVDPDKRRDYDRDGAWPRPMDDSSDESEEEQQQEEEEEEDDPSLPPRDWAGWKSEAKGRRKAHWPGGKSRSYPPDQGDSQEDRPPPRRSEESNEEPHGGYYYPHPWPYPYPGPYAHPPPPHHDRRSRHHPYYDAYATFFAAFVYPNPDGFRTEYGFMPSPYHPAYGPPPPWYMRPRPRVLRPPKQEKRRNTDPFPSSFNGKGWEKKAEEYKRQQEKRQYPYDDERPSFARSDSGRSSQSHSQQRSRFAGKPHFRPAAVPVYPSASHYARAHPRAPSPEPMEEPARRPRGAYSFKTTEPPRRRAPSPSPSPEPPPHRVPSPIRAYPDSTPYYPTPTNPHRFDGYVSPPPAFAKKPFDGQLFSPIKDYAGHTPPIHPLQPPLPQQRRGMFGGGVNGYAYAGNPLPRPPHIDEMMPPPHPRPQRYAPNRHGVYPPTFPMHTGGTPPSQQKKKGIFSRMSKVF